MQSVLEVMHALQRLGVASVRHQQTRRAGHAHQQGAPSNNHTSSTGSTNESIADQLFVVQRKCLAAVLSPAGLRRMHMQQVRASSMLPDIPSFCVHHVLKCSSFVE